MKRDEPIGPYRLIEPLGAGGMGAVWRGWDERLKRPVALKRILPAATGDPRSRERFRREAEAEARLSHPSIVHIYDIVETEENDWIVMELVQGQTLLELLREGPLEPRRALRLGREIAEGLAEAHAHGFVHRDLKSPNVMVTPAGRAKILDFGVAKQILPDAEETSLSAPGVIVGTYYAMSPEQAMGLPVDARSDLFSLGSLLYEMVTGAVPFRAESAPATLARICSFRQRAASTLRPDLPPEFSDLIDRLLEKEPRYRPQSAAEVVLELERLAMLLGAGGSSEATSKASANGGTALETTVRDSPAAAPAPRDRVEPVHRKPSPAMAEMGETLRSDASAMTSWKLRRNPAGAVVALLVSLALVLVMAQKLDWRAARPSSGSYELYRAGLVSLARFDRPGNLDAAIESFQKALAQNDRYAPAYAGLARACWLKFDGDSKDVTWLDRARSAALRAVELDGYLAMARVSLGLVELSSGQLAEAHKQLGEALLLEPLNADAFYGLARVHETQGSLGEAETAYRRAAEIRPDRMFFDGLGSLYLRESRTDEAVAAFQRSIALAPDSYLGFRNLAGAYYAQGKLAEASTQLQKALEIRPQASLYSDLGTLYFAEGLYEQCVAAFEKALTMPGGANNYLVWANLGDAYRWASGQREKSLDAYQRAIQLLRDRLQATPDNTVLLSRLALFLAKRGDRSEALALIDKIEKRSPKEASIWYRLAVASEVSGKRDRALAALRRALQAGLSLTEVKKDPELLALREDVRYHQSVARFEPGS